MRKYELTFSILGSGNVTIRAKNRLLAEESFYDMSLDDLVIFSDFRDGLEILTIEKI